MHSRKGSLPDYAQGSIRRTLQHSEIIPNGIRSPLASAELWGCRYASSPNNEIELGFRAARHDLRPIETQMAMLDIIVALPVAEGLSRKRRKPDWLRRFYWFDPIRLSLIFN